MSSTKRGGQRSEADNYPSPFWCIHRLIDRVRLPVDGIWYEPCAGQGAIIQALNTRGEYRDWWANELREEERPRLQVSLPRDGRLTFGDILDPALQLPPRDQVTVVITNPPYRFAWELLHKMLREFPQAYIALLLRVNFIASKTRYRFMCQYMPDLYVLPNRPGFKRWGKTDSPEYGWFIWGPTPRQKSVGRLELLGITTVGERRSAGTSQSPISLGSADLAEEAE